MHTSPPRKTSKLTLRAILVSLICTSIIAATSFAPGGAQASTSSWIRSISVQPMSTTDFSSEDMQKTLQNIASTGANQVALIIPYYQQNRQTTEMYPGWNTPTDEALVAAITYAHSIGLDVMLKPHLETVYIDWRGNIDPAMEDRPAWFRSYGNMLLHYAQIAEANGVEDICLGTELLHFTNPAHDPRNTQFWTDMIASVRSVYSGKLTYSANWYDELDTLGFWSQLDYIGVSAYYDLSLHWYTNFDPSTPGNPSMSDLKKGWEHWKRQELDPIAASHPTKKIVFTEVGYRSIQNTHYNPWDWGRQAAYNEVAQSNAYEAMMSFWQDVPWMGGVVLWRWDVDNSRGGPGDTDYTPYRKLAESTLRTLWAGSGSTPPSPPPPTSNPPTSNTPSTFTTPSIDIYTSEITAGEPVQFKVTVNKESGSGTGDVTVDVEIFDTATNERVFQRFFERQTVMPGSPQTYDISFTPPQNGTYRIDTGIFNGDWSVLHLWGYDLAQMTAGNAPGNSPPTTDPDPDSNSGPLYIQNEWPTQDSLVSGLTIFKGQAGGRDPNSYEMYWQVDGDRLNPMQTTADGSGKEAWVDVSGWNWREAGTTYHIDFIVKDIATGEEARKGADIYIK